MSEDDDLWEIMEIEEFMKGDYNLCILRKDSIYAKVHKFFHRIKVDFDIVKLPITIDDLPLPLPCVLTKNCLLALIGNKDKCRRIVDIIKEPPMKNEAPPKDLIDEIKLAVPQEIEIRTYQKTSEAHLDWKPIEKVPPIIIYDIPLKTIQNLYSEGTEPSTKQVATAIRTLYGNKLSDKSCGIYAGAYKKFIRERITILALNEDDKSKADGLFSNLNLSDREVAILEKMPLEDVMVNNSTRKVLRGLEERKIVRCANIINGGYIWELTDEIKAYYRKNPSIVSEERAKLYQ